VDPATGAAVPLPAELPADPSQGPRHPALEPLAFDQYASKLYAYLQVLSGPRR
jgi:hypothetical protein